MIGTLTLQSTFASISVTFIPDSVYAEADLTLDYHARGSGTYIEAHPLAKISDSRFLGSIMFLEENTEYTVRVMDTAGGYEAATISTKESVFTTGTGTAYYVSKTGSDSNPGTENFPFLTITKAHSVSAAGSVIHIGSGTYYETITVTRSGSSGNYIKYVGDGQVYITGADETYDVVGSGLWTYDAASDSYKTNLGYRTYFVGYDGTGRLFNYRQRTYTFTDFSNLSMVTTCGYWSGDDGYLYVHLPGGINPESVTMQIGKRNRGFQVMSANYLLFENLNIGHCGSSTSVSVGIDIRHGSNIAVRHCKIHHVYYGVYISYDDSSNNLVENCEFYDDPDFLSWPWAYNKAHDTETVGVCMMAGGGNVVRNNYIHDEFNGINPGSWGYLTVETYNYNVDVYENYIERIGDDCLEPEGANINTRMWNNTLKDTHMGISMAPITVGPLYVIRNKVLKASHWNWEGAILKYANGATYGLGKVYLYHNTGYHLAGYQSNTLATISQIGKLVYRNNVFYGDRYAFENNYSMPYACDWDYDCIHTKNSAGITYWVSAFWYGVATKVLAATIAAFRTATGQETNGISSDPLFADVANHDVSLTASSPCLNTGTVVTGINDRSYVGAAPDMGAVEYGVTLTAPAALRVTK